MKNKTMKIASVCALMGSPALAAQVSLDYSYDSGAIVSMVHEFEGMYSYSYEFNKKEFEKYRDLSNFYFYICDSVNILNIQTTNISNYNVVMERGYFKIDDITISNDEDPIVRVMFDSPNIPTFGGLTYKYSTISSTESVVVPSCQIPESSSSVLGLIGTVLLLRKRKR